MDDELVSRRLHKFNAKRGEDFTLWSLRFEALLESRDLLEVVNSDQLARVAIEDLSPDEKTKVLKAKSLLVQSLGDKPLRTVAGERKNPFQMYKKLHERYATQNTATRVQLQTELYQQSFQEKSQTMSEYVDSFENIFNQLEVMESPVTESMQIAILFASFGRSSDSPYGAVITALQTMSDKDLSWEKATARLLQEYSSLNCDRNLGRVLPNDMPINQKALKTKAHLQCYGCGKYGHFKRDCRARTTRQWTRKEHNAPINMNRFDIASKEKALLSRERKASKNYAVVDSGASNHMMSDRNLFDKIVNSQTRIITLGDGNSIKSNEKGSVYISTRVSEGKRKTLRLNNVLYVPGLDTNLVSCSALDRDGYETKFSKGCCTILMKDEPICTAQLEDGLYILKDIVTEEEADIAVGRTEGEELWHWRFGHVYLRTLKEMEKSGAVTGISFTDTPQNDVACVPCVEGKQSRLSLYSRKDTATKPGEVIFTDVCGPLPTPSLGGKSFFITFSDSFSSFKDVFLMATKGEALDCFKSFQATFERKYDCKIKLVYSDNGGEYLGMLKYLEKEGIEWESSAPYTPQQNGVSERLNRTLMEMARSMLSHAGLPDTFWGEAVCTAKSIRNVTAGQTKGGRTPIEILTGKVPHVGNLRCFGCEIWSFVSKRKKLDAKSRRGILLRSLPHRNYRVWDIKSGNIFHVRHVKINESVFPGREWDQTAMQSGLLYDWISNMGAHEYDLEDGHIEEAQELRASHLPTTAPNTEEIVPTVESPTEQNLTYYPNAVDTNIEDDGRRYPMRVRNPPERLGSDFNALVVSADTNYEKTPTSLAEALFSKNRSKWIAAIEEEILSLESNDTWKIVQLPPSARAIDSKLVFVLKLKADGSVDRYKVRLVAKGFQEGHVDNVYAPVVDFSTVRLVLAIMSQHGAYIHQLDVKSAFLNGKLDDEDNLYLNPPEGLELGVKRGQALKMLKAMYGFKRAPKIWSKTWNAVMHRLKFVQLKSEECFYFIDIEGSTVYVLVYVDDILVVGITEGAVLAVKQMLMNEFRMTDLGVAKSFLGVEFVYTSKGVSLRQEYYIKQVLEAFGMADCKPVSTPLSPERHKHQGHGMNRDPSIGRYREAIGALLYISTRTRPDIAAAVGILARKCEDPNQADWIGVKRIMRYLKGTASLGLHFTWRKDSQPPIIESYADADWAGDISDRKSTSGIVVTVNGTPVVWKSKKQGGVALSSTEAEFISISECVKATKWLRMILKELSLLSEFPTVLYEDNTGAIKWTSGEKMAKHVHIRFHFVKEAIMDGSINICYCPTSEMIADALTKGLSAPRTLYLRQELQIQECD